jgi:putative FMN-dependent luciferase-like monooxygenase
VTSPSLAIFTRLLDDATPAERYRLATEQITHAESLGFDSAWVAQHHFHETEGGLPSPLVFLASVAARTTSIRLGTGIITLPLEDPVRVAEDAVVLDLISNGRVELGLGSGGTPTSFTAFGQDSADRSAVFTDKLSTLLRALEGSSLGHDANHLYPAGAGLLGHLWQATFSAAGGQRAGTHGHGLMLSRTQPRPAHAPKATLADIQLPIIEAYRDALPAELSPRIVGSRTLFVADDRAEARRYAEIGLRRAAAHFARIGQPIDGDSLDDLIVGLDTHVGTPDEVIESLQRDATLGQVTELAFQVHSVDPPHELILRSLELIATEVAPALGWAGPAGSAGAAASPAYRAEFAASVH